MFKKRRFKPVNKKMVSLGLAVIMLMSVPGKSILSYAMTGQEENAQKQNVQEQSVESESGYRLYADELTSDSGAVKGDITEVLPEYEIINVKLPDGSLAAPEEVNFPVTESGEYVFEVIYNSASNDADPAKTAEAQITAIQSEDAQSAEEQSVEEQSASDSLPELAGDTESEELTLTVTLPEEEPAEPVQEETSSTGNEPQEAVARSSAPISLQTNSNISTRAVDGAGWDTEFDYYGSRLNWTRDRFKNYTTYWGSTGGMSYAGTNQSLTNGTTFNYRIGDNDYALSSAQTPTFRWGYYNLVRGGSTYNWIQYSQGFSDISVNLSKDFALGGTMKIGDAFGSLDVNSEGAKDGYAGLDGNGLVADGGLTISLLPTGRQNEIINSSGNGLSGVQRLGAYGVFKDAIVMEFDVGHQNGYASITGSDAASFHITDPSAELKRVGDWYIYNDDLKSLGLGSYANTFYDKYRYPAVASQSHIGISVTGNDGYVTSGTNSSDRRFIWGGDTGTFDYKIEYRASEGKMYYSVRHTNTGTWEYVTECTIPSSYRNKQYTVATSFSAIYQDWSKFKPSGGYFNGATNANNSGNTIGPGQMELTLQGVYSQPSLDNLDNQVVFMEDNAGSLNEGTTSIKAYQQGYVAGTETEQEKQEKRKYFPLEGDKIIIQNQADISALFNETASTTGDITLTRLSFRDLQFVDNTGKKIDGIPPGLNINSINDIGIQYYYSVNGGQQWIACNKDNQSMNRVISNATQPLRWRVVITLPKTTSITDSTNKQFWLTGETVITVSRGGSTASFNLPWVKENSERVTFFSNPKDVGVNNLGKDTARVIKSSSGISTLYGNKKSTETDAVSYGLNVWYNSTQRSEAYDPSYSQQNQTYEYKSIDQIRSSSEAEKVTQVDTDINLSDDTRYIVTYSLYDSVFNTGTLSSLTSYTGNMNRAQTTTKRVIWYSDNVEVQNGYEFYAKQNVTMSKEEFEGFSTDNDKAPYYRKIAEAAGASVFKTSEYNFTDLINGSYANNNQLSGNNNHQGILDAIANPDQAQPVQIKYTDSDGQEVVRTIQLTLTEGVKSVTLEDGTTIGDGANDKYAKIMVKTGENHTFDVKATFKYDDTAENFKKIKDSGQLFAALYHQDNTDSGDIDGTGNFTFLKGSGNVTSPSSGTSLVTEPIISELDEQKKTFTVTFTVTDNDNLTTDNGYSNYNHKDYQIIAWTSANKAGSFTGDGAAVESFDDTTDHAMVPQVRSKIYVQKPITVTNGYDARTEKFYKNTGSFTTSFDYDARSEFTGSNAAVNYAIYRLQGGNNQLGICETGTINLTDGSVSRIRGNQVFGTINTVTAELKTSEGRIELTIELNSNEGRTRSMYRVYVWNESNGTINLLQDPNTIHVNYRASDPLNGKYPLSETKVLKIPKVYTQNTTETTQTEKNKLFYESDNITISATFTLEGGTVDGGTQKETVGNLLDDKDNQNELKIALYKKNPDSASEKRYQMFALATSAGTSDGLGQTLSLITSYKADSISDAVITKNDDRTFTVTFTKTGGSSTWDDGAKYCIYVWTKANDISSLPLDFGVGEKDKYISENDIKGITTIPSVETTLTEVLGEQVNNIIHYPKEIVMMDNVKPDNKHIFSANQKITMTPLKVQEGSQTIAAEVPNPDSGVDVVIKEISDNQDVEKSIKVSRTVGSSDEIINLTCFLGTIESSNAKKISSNGKVGTLYFADGKNEIPLYFRSSESTPPNVADGAPLTGQIHFIFSKSGSGN